MAVSFICRGVPGKKRPNCCKSLKNLNIMLYPVHLSWAGFELTSWVVILTDCSGSCKSNYGTSTTTSIPNIAWICPDVLYEAVMVTRSGGLQETIFYHGSPWCIVCFSHRLMSYSLMYCIVYIYSVYLRWLLYLFSYNWRKQVMMKKPSGLLDEI